MTRGSMTHAGIQGPTRRTAAGLTAALERLGGRHLGAQLKARLAELCLFLPTTLPPAVIALPAPKGPSLLPAAIDEHCSADLAMSQAVPNCVEAEASSAPDEAHLLAAGDAPAGSRRPRSTLWWPSRRRRTILALITSRCAHRAGRIPGAQRRRWRRVGRPRRNRPGPDGPRRCRRTYRPRRGC